MCTAHKIQNNNLSSCLTAIPKLINLKFSLHYSSLGIGFCSLFDTKQSLQLRLLDNTRHRIRISFAGKDPIGLSSPSPVPVHYSPKTHIMCLRVLFKCLSKSVRFVLRPLLWGTAPVLNYPLGEELFPNSNLKHLWQNFRPLPQVPSLVTRKLQTAMRSPLSLLLSKLNRASDLSCSS